jgi:hypothetical protein
MRYNGPVQDKKYKLCKRKDPRPILVGSETFILKAFAALKETFYFRAGAAAPRTDEFPYYIEEA